MFEYIPFASPCFFLAYREAMALRSQTFATGVSAFADENKIGRLKQIDDFTVFESTDPHETVIHQFHHDLCGVRAGRRHYVSYLEVPLGHRLSATHAFEPRRELIAHADARNFSRHA